MNLTYKLDNLLIVILKRNQFKRKETDFREKADKNGLEF